MCNPVTSCSYVLFRNEPWTDRCIITALVSYYAVLSSCIEIISQKPVLVTGSLTLRLLMSYIYGAHILDVSRSHTTTHHSRYDSSGRVISSSQRPLPDNTRHSQQTNIYAPGGIRTHDLSRRAATGPPGHGYLSVVSVVCCQVEVSATSLSLVQRSRTDCAASLCVI